MKEMVHPIPSGGFRPAGRMSRRRRSGGGRQNGAIAIMFAGVLMLIIGFFGMALDLARIYNRKVEMQGVATTVALAAARKLNGKSSGVSDALAAASGVMSGALPGALRPKYAYKETMIWSDAAIQFGKSATGGTGWVDAGTASASPDGYVFVKVDTSALDSAYGSVDIMFMQVLSPSNTATSVSHTTIAGPSRIGVTPLAICAMSANPSGTRPNPPGNPELTEYGFRRGVSYDLMQLNPNGTTAVNYLVDPIAPPGGAAPTFALATVGPYVCTGTVALGKVSGGTVSVQSGFPIASLFNHLNSRFDQYNGQCDPNAAPPDTNIKQYLYTNTSIGWMGTKPGVQSANLDTSTGRRQTIADLVPAGGASATQYGPLWAYARPVPGANAGTTEPANGYTTFAATPTIWSSLYATTTNPNGYPGGATATPYIAGGAFSQVPSVAHRPGIKNRRVLNVPLLACPVTGTSAAVLAVGKFFMTVPADATHVYAEFGGATADSQLSGQVELH
jgi:Flp pilus assembly protein TadG